MSHDFDPVQRLEHDHVHIGRLVTELRESIQEVLRGERSAVELRDTLDEFLALAQEEIFAHFEREETGVFPLLAEHLPDTRAVIAELELAHDRMCGVVSRMQHLVRGGDAALTSQFEAFVGLFARFDANFVKHARDEWELLRNVAERLGPEQRRELARRLESL
jgi:iron-sulfur cluster repair protein YtfE (RIC family)